MCFPKDHFRCQVVQSATNCLSSFASINRPSEVCYFDFSSRNEQVLRFYIAMDNITRVQIAKALQYLLNNRSNLFFTKFCSFFEFAIELALWSMLKYQINGGCVPKIAKQLQYILVIKRRLDDYFSFNLLSEVALLDLLPLHALQSNDIFRRFLPCEQNLPKSPFPHSMNDLKIFELPFSLVVRGRAAFFGGSLGEKALTDSKHLLIIFLYRKQRYIC